MAKFTLTHEINCDADTFWKLFLDKPFNEALFRQGLKFPRYDIIEQRETDTQVFRKVSGEPKMDLPGPVQKLLGNGFSYTEEGTLDKASKTWKFKMTPSTMADKMRNEGTMRIEAAGAGKVKRVAELIVEAKMFGVGGMIEGAAEKSMRDGWDRSARFMNDWIKDGKVK